MSACAPYTHNYIYRLYTVIYAIYVDICKCIFADSCGKIDILSATAAAAAGSVDCAAFINFKLVKIEKQVEIITANCND